MIDWLIDWSMIIIILILPIIWLLSWIWFFPYFFIKLHIWLFQYLFLWWLLLLLLIINSYGLFSDILILLIPFTVIILIIACYSHTHCLFYINLVLIRYRTLHWVHNSSIWIITHVIVRFYYVVAAHYFISFHFCSRHCFWTHNLIIIILIDFYYCYYCCCAILTNSLSLLLLFALLFDRFILWKSIQNRHRFNQSINQSCVKQF